MDEVCFVANFLGFLSVWVLGILVRGFCGAGEPS